MPAEMNCPVCYVLLKFAGFVFQGRRSTIAKHATSIGGLIPTNSQNSNRKRSLSQSNSHEKKLFRTTSCPPATSVNFFNATWHVLRVHYGNE